MKSMKLIALILVFAMLLCGCGQLIPAKTTAPTGEATEPAPETAPTAETAPTPVALTQTQRNEMLDAFRFLLEQLCVEHVWPDGTDLEFDSSFGSIEDNNFALADVDGDGAEELIVTYSTTYMAGMVAIIYGYDFDSGKVVEELREFPALTVYPDIIQADWSHNQGLSENFWPYTLYKYDATRDIYTMLASVDAWEKAYRKQDFDGKDFPTDIDTDGSGMVYFVTQNGEKQTLSTTQYEDWLDSLLGGLEKISFDWKPLDPAAIKEVK